MKTVALVLEDEQAKWLKQEALNQGGTSASAIARRVFAQAMKSVSASHPQSTTPAQATDIRLQPGENGL